MCTDHLFFMICVLTLGFIMAKRYVLSREKNKKVEKYLAIKKADKMDELSEEEMQEYIELARSLI